MTFYFKPPRGDIPLHRLQDCLQERINYLHYVRVTDDISECTEHFKFEYLTDGSALDRTGHFMLRLFALKLNSLKDFFLQSEISLFEKRLKFLRHFQVERELRTNLRHVKEILVDGHLLPKYLVFLQNFLKLTMDMIGSGVISHAFANDHSLHCVDHNLKVPFTFCLPLVASRDINVHAGLAEIPCGKWSLLLSCLFAEHIKQGWQQLSTSKAYCNIWDDDRLRFLFGLVNAQFKFYPSTDTPNIISLSAKDVDERSSLFPPCMKNLHTTLRQRHRLSHYSRFYYSLFLKDIGMPLMESIEFWSKEYSQLNAGGAACSHTWQRDNKRYLYSIRHLYGLEGSRREYRSPHCQQLQDMSLSASSEGGCPFVGFDKEMLLKSLHDKVRGDITSTNTLIEVKNREGATGACRMYGEMLLNLFNTQKGCIQEVEDIALERRLSPNFGPLQLYFNVVGRISNNINKY